jgi:hypothetical protein
MIFACSVAAAVGATLKRPSSSRATWSESTIERKFKSLITTDDAQNRPIKVKLKETIEQLGIDYSLFALVKADGITCYFICTSEQLLQQLHEHFAHGLMKRILEKIFTLLVNARHCEVFIDELRWDPKEFTEAMRNLRQLIALGQCF